MLKSVISECLSNEDIPSDHPRYKSLSSKLYEICKLFLKDAISGDEGIRDTMIAIVKPQASIIIQLDRQKMSGNSKPTK